LLIFIENPYTHTDTHTVNGWLIIDKMDELQLEYKELSKKKEEIESQIAELNEVLSTVSYLHSDTD